MLGNLLPSSSPINICLISMVLTTSAMANINKTDSYKVSTRKVSYTEANTDVTGSINFSTYLELTSDECYGKVFYDNTSAIDATIVIKDDDNNTIKSLNIKADSKNDCDWYGIGKYTIDLRVEDGSEILKGSISIGKSGTSF